MHAHVRERGPTSDAETDALVEKNRQTNATMHACVLMHGYFLNMPWNWTRTIDVLDDNPWIEHDDVRTVDVYLKSLGFTGRPRYGCRNCRRVFRIDIGWKKISTCIGHLSCVECHLFGFLKRVDDGRGGVDWCDANEVDERRSRDFDRQITATHTRGTKKRC